MNVNKSDHRGYSASWRQYRFQASSTLHLKAVEKAFPLFLSPHPLVQTSGRQPCEPLLGVIAWWQGQPVGLLLAEKQNINHGLVISWNVIKSHRGYGLGRKLIKQMELFAKNNDINSLSVSFRWDTEARQQITKTLDHLGWQRPQKELMLYKFSPKLFMQMAWYKKLCLPKGYTIFSWDTLSKQDKQQILNRQKKTNWYPVELSPLFDSLGFEPVNSIGLRLKGVVVGWLITHRVHIDVIEYSSLFVSPELQGLGRGVHLILEAIKRQHIIGVPHAIFQARVENTSACSFVERRMAETIVSQTSRWVSKKQLT
ncbi:MAG: GNAT family N-acetyltransferase [Methylococcales bacterium]|nr:GNAT family N-acetyltransferase [Methylococcales bacterium]